MTSKGSIHGPQSGAIPLFFAFSSLVETDILVCRDSVTLGLVAFAPPSP
jgi:hypothetical protein